MRAILITKDPEYRAELTEVDPSDLPPGSVTVDVEYSTLNYKDSLALTGTSPVVREFPMIPGIDFAGTVAVSEHPDHAPGDRVVLNGWGVGETRWGGFAEKARVPGEWLVPLPAEFTTRQAMAIGTAGYTAMLCVMALEDHGVAPDRGEVLVTGASGGVGSVAVALLAELGFAVVASTGRLAEEGYLRDLGAATVIDRAELAGQGRPLGKERWAGVVDTVGSHTLANACATTKYGGTVAACGLAGGPDLPATVMPFILRGVTLAGVDSVNCPLDRRLAAWGRMASDLNRSKLDAMSAEARLEDVFDLAAEQLAGRVRGRPIIQI